LDSSTAPTEKRPLSISPIKVVSISFRFSLFTLSIVKSKFGDPHPVGSSMSPVGLSLLSGREDRLNTILRLELPFYAETRRSKQNKLRHNFMWMRCRIKQIWILSIGIKRLCGSVKLANVVFFHSLSDFHYC
jgi:hypothetical protein